MAKKKGLNNYEIRGNVTAIFMENKKGVKQETLVDTDDLERLIKLGYHWHLKWSKNVSSYYAQTTVYINRHKSNMFYLHNLIMNTEPYVKLDHRNHNTLDNRKDNLRVITNKQNIRNRKGLNKNNSSGYRNVSHDRFGNPIVQLQDEYGKNHTWRNFESIEAAGLFAEKMRKVWYGEFSGE